MTCIVNNNSSPHSLLTIENSLSYMTTKELIATSRGRGWKGITYDVYGPVVDVEVDFPPADHHAMGYCLRGAGRLLQKRGGLTHNSVIHAGSLIVMPAGRARTWRGTIPPSLRVRIPTALLTEAAIPNGSNPERIPELIDVFNTRDLFVSQLAPILVSELGRPSHPAQPLLIESISYVLAAHLLRTYDAFRRDDGKVTGLMPRTLSAVISYIEENGHEPIALEDLARIANVSRFHFSRMFKLSTGLTPMMYVEQNRIRKAQALIQEEQLSLAAIATTVGFADQSHFTRRFRFHTGHTPSYYAMNLGLSLSRHASVEHPTRSLQSDKIQSVQ